MTDFRSMSIAEGLSHARQDRALAMKLIGRPLAAYGHESESAETAYMMAAGFPPIDLDVEKAGRRSRWLRRKVK